jgi:hypothetical protein
VYWQRFFEIYDFTQDREDQRFAMLATVISNMSGKALKRSVDLTTFMPNYPDWREKKHASTSPSLEQQTAQFKAFHAELKAKQGIKP